MCRKLLRPLTLALCLALLAGLLLPAPTPARASSNDGEEGYVRDEVNVKLFNASDLAAVSQQFKLQLVEQFGSRPIYRMRVADGTDSRAKADALALDTAGVEFAEANYMAGAPEGSGFSWVGGFSW